MSGRLIDLGALSERDRDAWEELAGRSLEPNPFAEPDFVVPAAEHLGGAHTALLAVEEDGDMTAAMPVVAGRWRRALPALASWRHLYSFLGSPLVNREQPERAAAGLLDAAAALYPRGYLVFEWLSADGPLFAALERARELSGLVSVGEVSYERAALERRADGGYQDHLRSHHRREMRRLGRRLEEELGGSLETNERAGGPEAVRRFLELEASTWKGREGTAMLANESHTHFFEQVCERFARAGRLQLLELRCGEQPVAMKCNLVAGPGIFCFKIGHDDALARFSPGIQLELANVERFHEGEAAWMDSCAQPDNAMINRLWPDRRRIATVVLGKPGLRTRAATQAFRMAITRRTPQEKAAAAENST